MIDVLLCSSHLGGRCQLLSAAQITRRMRMGSTGHLEPETMSTTEAVCRRPQIDPDPQTAIGLPRWMSRPEAHQIAGDVDRGTRGDTSPYDA